MRPITLVKLLETVATQSLYPNEILIIDGSTNNETQKIIRDRVFKNVVYYQVSDKDRGLTKQRNFGISKVSNFTHIVCFLDDDTLLDINYFKNLISTYNIHPEALGVNGYITNEVKWKKKERLPIAGEFKYDGWVRREGSRFLLRNKIGLLDDTLPGFMPPFSHGRSVSFLPPSGKIYPIEQMMGGIASYRKEIFNEMQFSKYFEGYGLYEDADFSLRLAKKGKLYINTKAKLEHHHDAAGRPNKFKYGKMVTRNGWYVWRVKYKKPRLINRIKWNATAVLLITLRFINVLTTPNKKEAFTEALGRCYGLISLIFNKPEIER